MIDVSNDVYVQNSRSGCSLHVGLSRLYSSSLWPQQKRCVLCCMFSFRAYWFVISISLSLHPVQVSLSWYEGQEKVDISDYINSGTWDIIACPGVYNYTLDDVEGHHKAQITFTLRIRRKTLFYTVRPRFRSIICGSSIEHNALLFQKVTILVLHNLWAFMMLLLFSYCCLSLHNIVSLFILLSLTS